MRSRRRRLHLLAIAISIIAALGIAAPGAQAATCAGADEVPSTASITVSKVATLCLLNAERAQQGLAPLGDDQQLDGAATSYSATMVQQGFFAHVSPAGQLLEQRLATYVSFAQVWDVGENLAWGTGSLATPRAIVLGWMQSAAHRANILNGRFSEIGIGIVNGSPAGSAPALSATYTTHFGTRTPSTAGSSSPSTAGAMPAATKRRIASRCARVARRTPASRATRSARTARCVKKRLRTAAAAAARR